MWILPLPWILSEHSITFCKLSMLTWKNPCIDANILGSYIDQTWLTHGSCKQNSFEYKLSAQYERLDMAITYLEEIHHSLYKRFLSAIEHLDYHPSIKNTKHSRTQNLADTRTNWAKMLCKKCDSLSQPYMPKRRYGELNPSKEIFLDQLIWALEQINSKLHKKLSRHKHFTLL